MAYLPQLKPEKLIRVILRQGFAKDRQSGSHAIFVHPDGRWTSIPIHRKTIGKGLLRTRRYLTTLIPNFCIPLP